VRLEDLLTTEGEKLTGELRGPIARLRDLVDVAKDRMPGRDAGSGELAVTGHDGQEVVEVMGHAGREIELVVRPAGNLERVRADAGQIEQVLMNLVVNARDAMPDGGRITISTENVDVTGEPSIPQGRYVVMTVADNGCGMDAETASRIFEPFFTTKEVGRGTGLGLSTVDGIVKQSGARIAVQSELGQGTSFTIYFLPVAHVDTPAKPALSREPAAVGHEAVLVVEDDPVLLNLVSEILRAQGYTVIEAPTGEAALTIVENGIQELDAVISDLIMPKLNGRELVRKIAQLQPNLAILLMSGFAGGSTESLGAVLGPRVGFIQKPFTPDSLLGKLREVLNGSATETR